MANPSAEPDLLTRLADLCVCDGDKHCLYCEARARIEAQDRTLRLAQDKMASQRRDIVGLNKALRRKISDAAPSFSPNFDERNGIR